MTTNQNFDGFADEVTRNRVANKLSAFSAAKTVVEPIIQEHELEQYSTGANMFARTVIMTPTEQHITHILNVADWLLEP